MTEHTIAPRRISALFGLALVVTLAACGNGPAPSPPPNAVEPPAELRDGDRVLRASLVPAGVVGAAMARTYGIDREAGGMVLVISLRAGPDEASLPARVEARASDLLGRGQPIALREVRSDGYIDYVGTLRVKPPETLSFDINVEAAGAAPMTLRFSRDILP
ncbi:DUF4426 domain-containing protein [Luteimonas sp. MC1782]|uniref:DUF4426 domain-containing protein n=1 Tax=Luteimonas sp. MC1782 TaxID=2760305 RepID=UPI0015FED4F3|nr:DUF4426 domain-containing protein [Luteimonas sp. MC1782]MBB1472751.1 DUF4426 domain-containing protein [Luteimonas sp. MC1782]